MYPGSDAKVGVRLPRLPTGPAGSTAAVALVVAAALAAVWPAPVAFTVAVVLGWLLERPLRPASPDASSTGGQIRSVCRDAALIVLLARTDAVSHGYIAVVLACLVALGALGGAQVAVSAGLRRRRARAVAWRNIDVAGQPPDRELPRWLTDESSWKPWPSAALYGAAVAVCLGAPSALLAVGAGLALIAVAAVLATMIRAGRDLGRRSSDRVLTELAAAVQRLAPVVAMYVGAGSAGEQRQLIGNWLATLARLDEPVIVVLRDADEFRSWTESSLPMVLVSRARQLDRIVSPSLRLALYPSNAPTNNHLLRRPGITDVFVGDPNALAASRLVRVFDEVWVSGPAARERLRSAVAGLGADQIRELDSMADITGDQVAHVQVAVDALVGSQVSPGR